MALDELDDEVRTFCEARDWTQFHTPKDLAIGLSTESNELLQLFRFKPPQDQEALLSEDGRRADIEDEVADVLFFLLRFADLYDIDLTAALEAKLEKDRQRYPVDEYQGTNKRHDE